MCLNVISTRNRAKIVDAKTRAVLSKKLRILGFDIIH